MEEDGEESILLNVQQKNLKKTRQILPSSSHFSLLSEATKRRGLVFEGKGSLPTATPYVYVQYPYDLHDAINRHPPPQKARKVPVGRGILDEWMPGLSPILRNEFHRS
jgi:hypothetical protein